MGKGRDLYVQVREHIDGRVDVLDKAEYLEFCDAIATHYTLLAEAIEEELEDAAIEEEP